MKRTAFTLIELLVVVAIIALLLSIMAPVSRMVILRTEMVTCQSNLHQLGIANGRYLADNNSRFMPFRQWIVGGYTDINSLASSSSLIYKYVENARFFLCPTFKTVCASNAIRSYVMQHSFSDTEGWYNGNPWGNRYSINVVADVKDPSRLMLLSEEATWMVQADGVWYSRYTVNDAHLCCSDWPNRDTISQFHYPGPGDIDKQIKGLGNVLFVDGHVRPVITTQTPYVICQTWYDNPALASQAGL